MNRFLPVLLVACLFGIVIGGAGGAEKLNLLLITVDDMSADSIGAFGCKLADTTPNIDRLARQGLRFAHAHVQVGNCKPSRNVMWSGRYPHKPFHAQGRGGETVPDPHTPSRVFRPDEPPTPGFLFEDPVVSQELAHYYSSVRRADDGAGHILRALEDSGEADNTLVVFHSDHGMPLPFAKTQLYHHSTHTPLIFRWPGVTRPGSIDDVHMVSAVDFVPTLLDVVGVAHPEGIDGRSFAPLLEGETQQGRDLVVKEYNENAGGSRDPMRAVQTKRLLYLFNPWSNGKRIMATATTGTPTYRRMAELAKTHRAFAARHELYQHRVVEELYDIEHDPDCLVNLIDAPARQKELAQLRTSLEAWMVETGDHMLDVFRHRDDPAAREAYVQAKEKEANERRARNRRGRKPRPKPGRKKDRRQEDQRQEDGRGR